MPWRTAFSTSVSSVIGGHSQRVRRRIDVQRELEPVGHPHSHELEIGAHELELLAERRRGLVHARHGRAQIRDQAREHLRRLRRARVDERLHVRERVEQEMRLDLRLQEAQPRLERVAFELAALELELERLIAREHVALPHHRAERDPRREQQAFDNQVTEAQQLRRLMRSMHVDGHVTRGAGAALRRHGDDDADELQNPARQPGRQALQGSCSSSPKTSVTTRPMTTAWPTVTWIGRRSGREAAQNAEQCGHAEREQQRARRATK